MPAVLGQHCRINSTDEGHLQHDVDCGSDDHGDQDPADDVLVRIDHLTTHVDDRLEGIVGHDDPRNRGGFED